MIDKKRFFDTVRGSLFGGRLTTGQVKQMLYLIAEYERLGLQDIRWLAYVLGTVYHETALVRSGKLVRTMAPVEEMGRGAGRKYGKRVRLNGISYMEPHLYYGRGHTQNTWWENYRTLTVEAKKQGRTWNFLDHPELLLHTEPSVWATWHAMVHGLYTGKKLSDYFDSDTCDWRGARRIINGVDRADLVKVYAQYFYDALKPL